MVKKGNEPPSAPDAYKTAAAEAQFNRLNTYSPSGAGIRYGYTAPAGTGVPKIEEITSSINQGVSSGGEAAEARQIMPGQSTTTYKVGSRSFDNRADAVAYQGTLGTGESQFIEGVAPKGYQSAVKYIENPFEKKIRELLEPASVALTDRVVKDNIYNMPDAARVRDRSDVANDLFNRTFSLMAPGIDKANERLLTNLQARGIPIGSEAFNDAYGEQQKQTQETISRLAMDANLNAGAEQSRQFGLDQAQRSGSIAELVAAMGGGYNPPNSVPSGNAPGVNYSGMVGQQYQAEMANYQSQQQQKMQTAGALGSLGAALIKSTRAAKNVHGYAHINGAAEIMAALPIHAWTYKPKEAPEGDHGGRHIGPMAEDFQRMTGLGVTDKIDLIDYLGVLSAALQSALHRIADLENATYGLSATVPADETGRVH